MVFLYLSNSVTIMLIIPIPNKIPIIYNVILSPASGGFFNQGRKSVRIFPLPSAADADRCGRLFQIVSANQFTAITHIIYASSHRIFSHYQNSEKTIYKNHSLIFSIYSIYSVQVSCYICNKTHVKFMLIFQTLLCPCFEIKFSTFSLI